MFDLLDWRTISIDADGTSGRAAVRLEGVVLAEASLPAGALESMTTIVGPREVADGNTLSVYYDNVLVTHR